MIVTGQILGRITVPDTALARDDDNCHLHSLCSLTPVFRSRTMWCLSLMCAADRCQRHMVAIPPPVAAIRPAMAKRFSARAEPYVARGLHLLIWAIGKRRFCCPSHITARFPRNHIN